MHYWHSGLAVKKFSFGICCLFHFFLFTFYPIFLPLPLFSVQVVLRPLVCDMTAAPLRAEDAHFD